MTLIDKIRAEVEKKTYMEQGFRSEDSEYGYRTCARDILAIIDNLVSSANIEDVMIKEYNENNPTYIYGLYGTAKKEGKL